MARLILIRHAKSDWSAGAPDRLRPLSDRGRRQAPATGEWVAAQFDEVDLAVVSVAARAQQTWELVAAELDPLATVIDSEDAYTFDGADLADLVEAFPESAEAAILVGHNPALEELVQLATGRYAHLPTAAVAVLDLAGWAAVAGGTGAVLAAGRPADGRWDVLTTGW